MGCGDKMVDAMVGVIATVLGGLWSQCRTSAASGWCLPKEVNERKKRDPP